MSRRATLRDNLRFLAGAAGRAPRPVIYTAGWLGFGNLGDEALHAAARALVPPARPLLALGGRVAPGLVHLVRRPRTALLAGGTLVNGAPAWLRLFSRCQDLCDESLIFGSGVQDPSFARGRPDVADIRDAWVPVLRRCRYVGVRGPHSAHLLAEAGFDQAEVLGDPVLVFADPALARPAGAPVRGVLGLNLGQAGGLQWGEERQVVDQMADLARRARQAGLRVVWYVVWPRDRAVTEAAAAASGTAEDIREFTTDHLAYRDDVAGCDAFVGLKLHAVVLACCALVPSLMVEYRPKCRDFMASIGGEAATVRADRFGAEPALELVRGWLDDRAAASAQVADGVLPVAERLRRRAATILAGQ